MNYMQLGASVLSVGVTYGVLKSRMGELERRVKVLEAKGEAGPVLSERLARVEVKVDTMITLLDKATKN